MSEASIQIRRVTERVKSYYQLFGFRSHAVIRTQRSVIRGSRRLGFEEIECVVAETARGTSVGFYPIYSLQGLLYAIPYLVIIILQLLNSIESTASYISGPDALGEINWIKLLAGGATSSFSFYVTMMLLSILLFLIDFAHQRIRLSNLKSRFSFFTRDAIWETREVPDRLLAMKTVRSVLNHIWLLTILYFSVFAFSQTIQNELINLYNTTAEDLFAVTSTSYSIVAGFSTGLLAGNKAIILRKENAQIDKRSRISGGLLERRLDPILYAVESASYAAVILSIFLAVTFFSGGSVILIYQLLLFSIIGGILSGLIHAESMLWVSSSYGILIFFSSLYFIFQTGSQPAYSFIVVMQLFLLPLPFLLMLSTSFQNVLKKHGINSREWLFDHIILLPLLSLLIIRRNRRLAKQKYLQDIERAIEPSSIDKRIRINKEFLLDRNSAAHKLAMHYYELLVSYTASFAEETFILIPTTQQLINWWENKTKQKSDSTQSQYLDYVDKMLWDPMFQLDGMTQVHEQTALKMALAIQG